VPEEVRAAKRINSEGERIIDKAQEEAERIIARAQEQAAILIDERGLTDAASEEGRRIIEAAYADASEIRGGADDYAAGILEGLEADVTRTLRSIERGLELLNERRAALAPREDALAPDLADAGDGDPEGAYDMYDEDDPDEADAGPGEGTAARSR
jgi:cell division septum initiation protein DivIVA